MASEWLRRTPEETPGWSRKARCRKAECITKVDGLEAEIQFLKAELAPLKKSFKTEVEGQTRVAHAELLEFKGRFDSMAVDMRDAVHKRTWMSKVARELALENEELLSKVAALSSSYASLMGKHASSEKKATVERRRASQRERQLQASVARMEAKVIVADRRTEEAEELAGEALAAEQEADDRAAAAELRVVEAERVADEAVADSKAAADDAEAARHEASDAEYVKVITEAKLARARAKVVEKQAKSAEMQAELMKGPKERSVDEWSALTKEAEWKAAQRERAYLSAFLKSHSFRTKDIGAALDELGQSPPQPTSLPQPSSLLGVKARPCVRA